MKKISTAIDVLQNARRKGVHIYLDKGQLQLKYSKENGIDAELLNEIKNNKELITSFLKDNESKSNQNSAYETELISNIRDIGQKIPLSFSQERLWFIDRLESSSVQYHLPEVLRLKGKLNIEALEKALQSIVNRHEVVRTVFAEEDGKVFQQIKDAGEWSLNKIDGSDFKVDSDKLKLFIKDLVNKPFDLSKDYMIRADLITLGETENVLVVTTHHIASDGWSRSVLVREVVNLYRAFDEGRASELIPLQVQYADYAIWQRKYLTGEVLDKKLEYWKHKLEGVTQLQLPTDFNRPAFQSNRGAACSFIIDKALSDKLHELSQQYGATLFMTLLSAFKILLHRYSGQQDICVGTVVAGRHHQKLEELIGFFVNTLALRNEVTGDTIFTDLLQQVRRTMMEAQEHQDVPFEKIVDAVVKERSLSRSPLFQVMFMLQNTPRAEGLILGKVQLSGEELVHNTAKFELTFSMNETSTNGLKGTVEYCTDLYEEQTIERMINHFKELLNSIVQSPQQNIGSLSMITKSEKNQLLKEFNDIVVDNSTDKTVVDCFEDQVSKTPDNIALVFEETEMTYRELNERSNQLAHFLKSKGINKETLVPIFTERSLEMMVGILGILKAGGAYVPIDPDYPQERINYILKDTGSAIVLCSKNCRSKLPVSELLNVIEIDRDNSKINNQSSENLHTVTGNNHLAYVIYTSGSTGKPKGVMIEHKNLISYLLNNKTRYISEEESNSGSFIHLPYTFDASVTGMFMPLLSGKSVVIGSMQSLETFEDKNFQKYAPYDFIKITPSHLGLLQPMLKRDNGELLTNKLVIGGEALLKSQLNYLIENKIEVNVINEFGPTEATVGCSVFSFKTSDENKNLKNDIPIGKPIENVRMYILSDAKELVPVGVAGEIFISGSGLARGYLNLPDLTLEKFVKDPFSETGGALMYRTGDLGRWLSDGSIEYLGRIDDQVKIRGYRIELGEIESVLQEIETVRQSVVLARGTSEGSKRLVGYVVPEGKFDKDAVMSFLKSRLPDYMIPQIWMELDSLPLTSNGKIDRKALPDPDASELLSNKYISPRNETEEKLAEIWKELLRVERVGINDNFFELGGDSIITIQVVSRARRVGFELKPKDIFIYQTVGSLSAAISERTKAEITGEQGVLTGHSGLLPIQQWYLDGAGETVSHFNQTVLLSIDKTVTQDILSKAVEQLTLHHDALRFKYQKEKDGHWTQEYGTKQSALITVDLQESEKDKLGSLINEHSEKYQRSLDIEKGELTKFVFIKTPEEESKNRILIVIHHLAVDGVSWRILLEDLELLITGLQNEGKADLGNKSSSYRQWYNALMQYGQSRKLLSHSDYWEQIKNNYESLPTDKEYTGTVSLKDVKSQVMRLDKDQTQKLLQEVPGVYHTEINDILLCALAITLCNWSSKEKIVIGLEGHGRENISEETDTSRTVGWFTNLYPVLLKLTSTENLPDSIKSVKEQLRHIPDKGLGYGILKYINKDEKLSGNECWDVVFNYLGQMDNVVNSQVKLFSGAGESKGSDINEEQLTGVEKLMINGLIRGGQLILNWGYSSLHYEKDTIEKLAESYKTNLELLISHCIEKEKKSGAVYTPSDYGLGSEISNTELDKFLEEPYKGKPRKESIEGLYRLSGLQQGMLFHALYDSRAGAYTEQLSCELSNPDLEKITKSWNHVLNRHSILRSGFYPDEFRIPVQCVYREVEMPVELLDYRDIPPEDQEASILQYRESDRLRGFDFKTVPLMRISLIRLSEDRYRMLWTSHHIIFDGWSLQILVEEFLSNYEELAAGKELVKTSEDRYEDYIRYIERSEKDKEETYWRSYMQGVDQSTLLPFIGTTSQRTKGVGSYDTMYLRIDEEKTSRISQFAQKHHITVNTLMQGVWSYLLHAYTGSSDVVYGVIVSGRPDDLPGIWERVGLYINTLPLHTRMNNDESISQWLQELQKNEVSSRQYQYTPIQDIQRWTGVSGDLFDSLLVFENYPVSEIVKTKQWSLQVQNMQMQEQTNYPLTIIVGIGEKTLINFSYNTQILNEEYITEIREHFENVLMQVITKAEGSLRAIELLSGPEKKKILEEFNETESEYPKDKTIIDLFEEQAAKTPDKIALVFEDQQLTYKELNEKSNQLANYLIEKGVQPGENIGLLSSRCIEMLTGMFGILKSGCSYVPFNTEYPSERLKYIIEDTSIKHIVFTEKNLLQGKGLDRYNLIDVKDSALNSSRSSGIKTSSDSCVYVMFTSGTTGRPKGIAVSQRNVIKLVYDTGEIAVNADDRVLQWSNYSFDGSTYDIYSSLLKGASLHLIKDDWASNAGELFRVMSAQKITICFMTTALFNTITDVQPQALKGLRKILFGGEKVSLAHVQKALTITGKGKITHVYGPTETTTYATSYPVDEINSDGIIPIGKPLSNTKVFVLNTFGNPVPVGVAGELCIGGDGVSLGYVNNIALTEEKFIDNPFNRNSDEKLYRTGDIVRWLPDGNIEYLGRIDDQVKIRGYRIELAEIDIALQECELVRQGVVLARDDMQSVRTLVGYVVANGAFDREAIMLHLRKRLPEYMIPALWVELKAMPLTANGKTDRKALPYPDAKEGFRNEYEAPRNELEWVLAKNWQQLLGVDRVGINDNFFELGGHSLLALQIFGHIEKITGKKLAISTLFNSPTIKELAKILKDDGWTPAWKSLVAVKPGGSKLPLYCVPAAASTALSFQVLSKYMMPDQPLYALDPIGIDGKEPPQNDIKEMAAFYIKEIQMLQPEGPYLLGGRCMGSTVALEMAQQLKSAGHEVALIAVLDTRPPVETMHWMLQPRVKKPMKHFVTRSFQNLINGTLWNVIINYSSNKFRKAKIKVRKKVEYIISDPKRRLYKEILVVHMSAWIHYIAKKYRGKITLIEAEVYESEDRVGWKNLAEGGLESHVVPGSDHFTIATEPNIKLLAEKLNYILEKTHKEIEIKIHTNGSVRKHKKMEMLKSQIQ